MTAIPPTPIQAPLGFPLHPAWNAFLNAIVTQFAAAAAGKLIPGATPATSSAAGTPGQVSYDTSYLYLCVAANSWRRIALTTF